MPIDIKWVRNHPGIVKEWQRVRRRRPSGRGPDDQRNGQDRDQVKQEDPSDLVDLCVQYGTISRKNLQKLEDMKRQLNSIQRQLRPKSAERGPPPPTTTVETTTKEQLLQERKELQDQIVIQQKTYQESCRKTNQALWVLASPVDLEADVDETNDNHDTDNSRSLDFDFDLDLVESDLYGSSHEDSHIIYVEDSSETNDTFSHQRQEQQHNQQLEHAFIEYTSRFFNSYNQIVVPYGRIESNSDLATENHKTKNNMMKPSSSLTMDTTMSSHRCTPPTISYEDACEIWGSLSDSRSADSAADAAATAAVYSLPTWVRLLTDYNNSSSSSSNNKGSKNNRNSNTKKKSIWGDKQLPAYAAIWGHHHSTFDLVALTASSLVDARLVRKRLVHDLKQFYESFLIFGTAQSMSEDCGGDPSKCEEKIENEERSDGFQNQMKCHVRRVPPNELECDEWSRVEIWVEIVDGIRKDEMDNDLRFRLGSVSHWGDAISRANEMVFASGGNPSGKNKQMNANGSREYVHIIQASVVADQTWKKIMRCQTILSMTSANNDSTNKTSIHRDEHVHHTLPPALKEIFEDLLSNSVEDNTAYLHSERSNSSRLGIRSIFGPLKNKDKAKNSETVTKRGYDNITGTATTKSENSMSDGETPTMNPNGDEQFWREDAWTEEDEEKAKQVLSRHLAKCKISSILPIVGDDRSSSSPSSEALPWDVFYQTHETKFFKDRHYLSKSFPEEFRRHEGTTIDNSCTDKGKTIVEIGCGVGNAILPLLETDNVCPQWSVVHGLDISPEAIRLLKVDPRFSAFNNHQVGGRAVYGHVCDIAKEPLPPSCVDAADVTSMLFCLSAIDPDHMETAARTAAGSLKEGGMLVFRDYGRYDEAQMKLGTSRSKLIKDNFYRKSDGTKCYYFTLDDLNRLFVDFAGLEAVEVKTLRRAYPNKATGQERRRVWVQGRFRKPIIT